MPTPSDNGLIADPAAHISRNASSSRLICPPEDHHGGSDILSDLIANDTVDSRPAMTIPSPEPSPSTPSATHPEHIHPRTPPPDKSANGTTAADDGSLAEILSPTSSIDDSVDIENRSSLNAAYQQDDYEESPFPHPSKRFLANSSSSLLQPGSKFRGEQKSDSHRYGVQVEIQHVDMAESFLCGYLSIQGLTDSEQTLTTYFEGEIIGTKYTFQTKHDDWGSNERVDMQHWARFPAWRPLSKQAKRPDFTFKNFAQRENIFMRWKEYFLVPDHTRKTVNGASYEGFYYICFNQVSGTISGMYYHARTSGYQKLELQHVNDHGCLGVTEFR